MTTEQTFEEAVAEFLERTREQIGNESQEGMAPGLPSPFDQSGPPYEFAQRFDSALAARFSLTTGDGNPLFTDPEYGKHTKYGTQLVPGTVFALVRHPAVHGVNRPGGYPQANFISGAAWEFFDVVRTGTKFRSSKETREVFEKAGSRGNLIFLISNNGYWDYHGDLLGKCYGTLIFVPMSSMGSRRSMEVDRLGEQLLYERKASQYNQEQVEDVLALVTGSQRRGADPRYWEDVKVGDKLGPFVLPPWTLQDQMCIHSMGYASSSGMGMGASDAWPLNPGTAHCGSLSAAPYIP